MLTLLYHEVTPPGQGSGLQSSGNGKYCISPQLFRVHLQACRAYLESVGLSPNAICFTFDDGGISNLAQAAPLLEENGFKGHFFIITSRIGEAGFLNELQIRELQKRGHIIGSHSHTHPARMNRMPVANILNEWQHSRQILENICGKEINTAAVPGGWYSLGVAKAAAEAGYIRLFNSVPTTLEMQVDTLRVAGRVHIPRHTSAAAIVHLLKSGEGALKSRRLRYEAAAIVKRFLY